MPKQRVEKILKNFDEVAGLWKENESEKMDVKIHLNGGELFFDEEGVEINYFRWKLTNTFNDA